jgi:membrane-bound lytic murein transglycosylase
MPINQEEFGKTTPNEASDSPSTDISAPLINTDISELPTMTEISEGSRNVNSSEETLPSTKTFEYKTPTKELQKHEKAKLHNEEDLKAFSTSEISACESDTTAVCKAAEGTKSQESSCKRKQQPSETEEPHQLAVSSDAMGVTNNAFEPDEKSQTRDDVQVGLMSLRNLRSRETRTLNGQFI